MPVHSRLNCYWNLKVMVLKEKGKSECLAKNILKHVGCRELYVNKLIHCTFMGISPPQNLRLSEDKNFVSDPPSKKGKKKRPSVLRKS